MSDDVLLWGLGLVALAAVLWLAWKILVMTWDGAVLLLCLALGQGFLGGAAYVASWVFMLPIMALICFAVGGWMHLGARMLAREERDELAQIRYRREHGLELSDRDLRREAEPSR